MIKQNHSKKPITASITGFFKRIFPCTLLERINKSFDLDKHRTKIFFRSFLIFLIVIIIIYPQTMSLRDLETMSKKESIQLLSGQKSISHTAIAERLKTLPSESLELVLQHVIKNFKHTLKHKGLFPEGMKVFDVTTYSVSAKHYTWAAQRQSRANIRFLFVMDSYSGTPDAIIDASKNLNDNKMFRTAISVAKNGRYFIFDKGFNSFRILAKIVAHNQHFVTRWKKNYLFQFKQKRKINPKEKLKGEWTLEADEIGTIGTEAKKTSLMIRKITCRNIRTHETFIVLTDDRNLPANKLVQMYVYRWPIEVFFRHIKSTLHLVRFPAHSPRGVLNMMIITVLSIVIVQLMTAATHKSRPINFMYRKSSFKLVLRAAQVLFDRWLLAVIKDAGGGEVECNGSTCSQY